MDPSVNISPSIALASILSGIFLVSLCVLLVQFLLLRRKASKPLLRGVAADDHDQLEQQQALALGASSTKEMEKQGRSPPPPLRASLNLEPNQPIFVDVTVVTVDSESESGRPLSHAEELLQLILTPPTPAKER